MRSGGRIAMSPMAGRMMSPRSGNDVLLRLRMRVSGEARHKPKPIHCRPDLAEPTARSRKSNNLALPSARIGGLFYWRPAMRRGLNGAYCGYRPTGKARVAGRVAKLAPCAERLAGRMRLHTGILVKA